MTHLLRPGFWFWTALVLSLGAKGPVANASGNPYLGIVGRNVFRLKPPQSQAREPASAPLARVRAVGITTMLGDKRALLKVYLPARPPEPAREVACILKVGQREGPIEVLDINEIAGSVKVDNSGTGMILKLEKESSHLLNAPPLPELPPLPIQSLSQR
jgi:hypothetical protein